MEAVQATHFTDRQIVKREDMLSLLPEIKESAQAELLASIEVVQRESVCIGALLGAVEMLMLLGKLPHEIIAIGRIYIIKETTTRIPDIQLLSWNLDHIVTCADMLWNDIEKQMPDQGVLCIKYVRQILQSLIDDFGESAQADGEAVATKQQACGCIVVQAEKSSTKE
ncbi:MAG: hypothetical protein G01um101448_231 [Parcubacteria group bacterium Gr01-1014_48]|nr:MAG: hypothetical protein Greene041614_659 [Parcubacteria group bacterium Greene0416_14]TSC74287.1 MAG: hypothetical protein G01um101448_231 [Parcubacteria group bacterium Gr01-1014_48]TSD01384.1 MAG: hypothetical protein Greene101415_319 [Parcubacteria group bacterium Greene1014_15]TSD08303.1 MAG: hypothetical protein Greene07144_221 [Parcubacteria group bacterium Greene0714_4]